MKPVSLKKIDPRTLGVEWEDAHQGVYDTTFLREHCTCAACVDEWTGERKVKTGMLPATVLPVTIDSVGNYGLQIRFSDGHATGIYTYDYLRSLCQCPGCHSRESGNPLLIP
ncbi:MAG: DUF971 domain-containing protein [Deltaproteobacteria bacterium]|nr:DUF971 domain-containing protein [Deltaproteobacteria bacterium]